LCIGKYSFLFIIILVDIQTHLIVDIQTPLVVRLICFFGLMVLGLSFLYSKNPNQQPFLLWKG